MPSGELSAHVEVPRDPRDLVGSFRFSRPLEVRFGDTDAMGHVNNAVYLTYCESARVSYFEAVTGEDFLGGGIAGEPDHAAQHGAGTEAGVGPRHRWSFILAEARVTYRSPAYFGETLTIETRTCRIGRSSMTAEYRITAPQSRFGPARLVATAESVAVGFDYVNGRPAPLPDDFVVLIEAYEGRPLREARS